MIMKNPYLTILENNQVLDSFINTVKFILEYKSDSNKTACSDVQTYENNPFLENSMELPQKSKTTTTI